jgi:Uma2 family endonuclease
MYDLPSEDPEDAGLPDEFHDFQPKLLRETCQPPTDIATELFIGADLNLYYDGRHPQWYKRPDWFLVLGVTAADRQEALRWSYVTWQESVNPFLVVELLSPGTEDEDLGQKVRSLSKPPMKWEVYEKILRVPFYVVFDRYQHHLRIFQLTGDRYQELSLSGSQFWFEALQLGLRVWQGRYTGVEGQWLRWYDNAGNLIPTDFEKAETEAVARRVAEQQAETEAVARRVAEQQAETEAVARRVAEQQAETEAVARRVAEQQAETEAVARRNAIPRLLALGLTPVQISESLLLPLTEVEQFLAEDV